MIPSHLTKPMLRGERGATFETIRSISRPIFFQKPQDYKITQNFQKTQNLEKKSKFSE